MHDRSWRILGATVAISATLLAGCKDARRERLEGAQRALAALPDVEVISTDAAAGTLTVRSRSTGAVSTIDLQSKAAPVTAAPAAGSPADTGAGAASPPSPGATAPAVAGGQPDAGAAAGPAAAPGTAATADGTAPSDGPTVAAAGTIATPDTVAAATAGAPVVVRDPQGRVQVIEGSGFRIERSPGTRTPPSGAPAPAAADAAPGADGALRRVAAPVVCGAGETRTLQGVLIDVPGAGIVAERGCTLAIANVRVRSGGWGLVVNPGASVRIDDSVVEGRTGALDLHPGASLSAWATTFRGPLGRPVAAPQFVDRGGNAWQ